MKAQFKIHFNYSGTFIVKFFRADSEIEAINELLTWHANANSGKKLRKILSVKRVQEEKTLFQEDL